MYDCHALTDEILYKVTNIIIHEVGGEPFIRM